MIAMAAGTYGGSPRDWSTLAPYALAGFLLNRPRVEAERQVRGYEIAIAASGDVKAADRSAIIDRWRLAIDPDSVTARPTGGALAALAAAGFEIEVIH